MHNNPKLHALRATRLFRWLKLFPLYLSLALLLLLTFYYHYKLIPSQSIVGGIPFQAGGKSHSDKLAFDSQELTDVLAALRHQSNSLQDNIDVLLSEISESSEPASQIESDLGSILTVANELEKSSRLLFGGERERERVEGEEEREGERSGSLARLQKVHSEVVQHFQAFDEELKITRQQSDILSSEQQKLYDLMKSFSPGSEVSKTQYLPRGVTGLEFNVITEGKENGWKQREFHPYGTYGFIKFSAYRMDPYRIAVIGLGALDLTQKRHLDSCEWLHSSQSEKPITSCHVDFLPMGEHHDLEYEVLILHCVMSKPHQSTGGKLIVQIDGSPMLLYVENEVQPLENPDSQTNADPESFPNHLVYCSPPLYGTLYTPRILEWIEFHRVTMNVDKFVMYDAGGVNDEIMKGFEDYVSNGKMEFVDFVEANLYVVWLYAQGVAIHDCIYRNRNSAAWVFMMDFDEYLETEPPHSMQGILKEHWGKPYVTFGSVVFSTGICLEKESGDDEADVFPIRKMVYRWPHNYCVWSGVYTDTDLCLDQYGHRKYFLNPRQVYMTKIHATRVPASGGIDLPISVARANHYRGLMVPQKLCAEKVLVEGKDNIELEWWWRHPVMSERVGQVIKCLEDSRKTRDSGDSHKVEWNLTCKYDTSPT